MLQKKILCRRGAETQSKSQLGMCFCIVWSIPYGIGMPVLLRASASLRRIFNARPING